MSEPVVGVQPTIFRWARISIGMTVEDVAARLKRQPEEIEAWETGEALPTYAQLEKLAYDIYKRPIAMFFLPTPPEEVLPQHEFRTLPDIDMQTLSRDTYLHIRRAHAYQFALKELFDDHNPANRYIWKDLRLVANQSIVTQAKNVRDYLGITLDNQINWSNIEHALKEWRKAIEDSGIFVFKAAFKQKEISGFCLVDADLPVIYLNNSTTKTRQIFSLLHELGHLLFNVNGLSKFDPEYIELLPGSGQDVERFCNAIAAEILIPSDDFSQQAKQFPVNVETASEEQFASLADRYSVSREVILRRFLDLGRVSQAFYETKAKFWYGQSKQSTGGNWYSNQGSYISNRFAQEVVGRHYRHQITLEQAASFLGIKPKNYSGFEEHILHGATT